MTIGKHPCLWCTVTTEEMQIPPGKRSIPTTKRSLESMAKDLKRFREELKGILKLAKEANNVIDDPYFKIALDQVHLALLAKSKIFNS